VSGVNIYYRILQAILIIVVCLSAIDVWEILPVFQGRITVYSEYAWLWAVRDVSTIILFAGSAYLLFNLKKLLSSAKSIVMSLITLWVGVTLFIELAYGYMPASDLTIIGIGYGVIMYLIYAALPRE